MIENTFLVYLLFFCQFNIYIYISLHIFVQDFNSIIAFYFNKKPSLKSSFTMMDVSLIGFYKN